MEITDIKQSLTLKQVLHHYNLKPDKNNRLKCPFHNDNNPSFQVYYKTHTGYCFSSNCRTHGRSLDVIDFILFMEGWDSMGADGKHKAIEKAKTIMDNGLSVAIKVPATAKPALDAVSSAPLLLSMPRTQFLEYMFTYFRNAVHNSRPAQEYIKQRGLDATLLDIGYNTAQFHHGARRDQTLINNCIAVGLLSPWGINNRRPDEQAYKAFAKYSLCFALKNRSNQITGLYFRSIENNTDQRHFYLKESTGLYPCYPSADTRKLVISESIIDAASLEQLRVSNLELRNYTMLAAYGTNRLNEEMKTAIAELKHLGEIIFAFDNDDAGNNAVAKYAEELQAMNSELRISKLELPCKDVNETLTAHTEDVFVHLLERRVVLYGGREQAVSSIYEESSSEIEVRIKKQEVTADNAVEPPLTIDNSPLIIDNSPEFNSHNPYKLTYTSEAATYCVQGGISKVLDSMKITLVVEHNTTQQKSRNKIDLYEDKQVEKLCKEVADKLNLRKDLVESDVYKLTDHLDHYREEQLRIAQEESKFDDNEQYPLTQQERQRIESFLKQDNLVVKFNELLGKSGIAGEEINRIFLLVIAISYKMPEPSHALIQGSSGSGKTRLLRQISDCIPPEKVIRLTRVSDKGFYNYPEKYLRNKLISLEDVDGLGEEATFAFRELQSNGELNSATSVKLDNGQIVSGEKKVKGPIASLACTTQGEIYEDNMSRVFLIAVDESPTQTKRIISYQNNKAAGLVDKQEEKRISLFIQNIVREIKPYEVINPYANKIHLPEEAHKIRRLNDLFQSFVKMITVVNQYQRRKDHKGRLVTETSDIETAIDIMFESIVLKVDELDGSLRQFFEKLKKYVEKQGKNFEFTRFEVREATGLGKTQQHHYVSKLLELEYLQQYGFANRGFKYRIVYWDNYAAIRDKIKQHLHEQLEQLKLQMTAPLIIPKECEDISKRTPANTSRTPDLSLRPLELVENQ